MHQLVQELKIPNDLSLRDAVRVNGKESEIKSGDRLLYWCEERGYRLRAVVEILDLSQASKHKFGAKLVAFLHQGQTDCHWLEDYMTVGADNLYFPNRAITDQDVHALCEARIADLDLRRLSYQTTTNGFAFKYRRR